MLKARDYRPDLDSRLGKTVMVAGARDAASGYHCKVCDCVLKDSKTYLDHINGRKRAFGCGVGWGCCLWTSAQQLIAYPRCRPCRPKGAWLSDAGRAPQRRRCQGPAGGQEEDPGPVQGKAL